ncbi:hypothetical protein [Amycolatopsis regifaucium]|uniref:hypothetical protein n=1 Tax=Amycolatopsis regifaucium TaxID=546365 RepID=UPI001160D906|nr:hypothetical protein [Amycolatopsis regifaucium]
MVLTLRGEATRLDGTSRKLSADAHDEPRRAEGFAGAFGGRAGLVCFVVPPGYRPGCLHVGERDREACSTL